MQKFPTWQTSSYALYTAQIGAIPHTQQDVTYASFHRPLTIGEGPHRATLRYGTADERRRMDYAYNGQRRYTKEYLPDGVEQVLDGGGRLQYRITYVPGNDGIAFIYKQEVGVVQRSGGGVVEATSAAANGDMGEMDPYEPSTSTLYYPYTDHLGSITTLTDGAGNVVQRQAFDAWGRRRNTVTWEADDRAVPPPAFEWLRGYTGHEHLDSFGLINMNARLYDPKMGRMLSVDNYVSAPGTAMGYNRYVYAFNNPISYTDPDGNWFIIDDAILGIVSGTINLVTNLGNVGSFWQGVGYFGVGFVSGALTTYITPVGSAALTGAGNAALGSYIKNGSVDAGAVIEGAVSSAITGGLTMGLGQAVSPVADKLFSGIASPVLRTAATQGLVGAGLGAVGGGVGSLMGGGDFWAGVGSGALWGFGIGAITGAATGYISAFADDTNPWTGVQKTHQRSDNPDIPRLPIRRDPFDLGEQMTLREAQSGLGEGRPSLNRNPEKYYKYRYDKIQHTHKRPDGTTTNIHYWKHRATGIQGGYKFKNPIPPPPKPPIINIRIN